MRRCSRGHKFYCGKTFHLAVGICVMLILFLIGCSKKTDTPPEKETRISEQSNIGKAFPAVTAETLEGNKESVPESARGKVTLVAVAFLQQNQGQLDSWLNPFAEKFAERGDFMFYEVPMISRGYMFMKPIIDRGMRGGLPQFKHKHVVTMYGDVKYYSDALNINPKDGHVFLLDREGIIRWQDQGYAKPEALAIMFALAEKLAQD